MSFIEYNIQKNATEYTIEYRLFTLTIAWLGAAAHCHCPASQESIILLAWEKIRIQSEVSTECILLSPTIKLINCKSKTIVSQGLS